MGADLCDHKRDIECCTYIKSAQRTRDGRKANRDLWDYLLGPDNVDNMASETKRLLVATHYSGEHKWFNFERYVKIQDYQYHILEGIKENGHVRIGPKSQVRHLIEEIKINQFDAVKDQIMTTASLTTGYN